MTVGSAVVESVPCPGTDPTTAIEAVFRIEFARLVARPDPLRRRHRAGRGAGPGRARRCAGAVARAGHAPQPRRVADDGRQAQGDRPVPPRPQRSTTSTPSSAERLEPTPQRGAVPRHARRFEDHIDDDRAAPDVRGLPSGPVGAGRGPRSPCGCVGGLTTAEIARAYLEPEATVAQRIVRAKKTIADAGVPFEVPDGEDRAARLGSVLEVVYLIFNEGYSATAGDEWMRPELCAEALRLGRRAGRAGPRRAGGARPDRADGDPVVAPAARVGPDGEPVLLLDQDRRTWDRLLINRGLAALERAERARRRAGSLRAAGRDRRLPRTSPSAPRTPTGDRSSALYERARRGQPVADRRAQPRRRRLDGRTAPRPASTSSTSCAARGTIDGYHLLHGVRGDLLASSTATPRRTPSSSWPRRSPGTTRNVGSAGTAPTRWRVSAEDPGPL